MESWLRNHTEIKPDLQFAKAVLLTLSQYLNRAERELTLAHVVSPENKHEKARYTPDMVLEATQRVWEAMKDLDDKSMRMTHSGYLKMYQLSRPNLTLDYDAILLDEAQDSSPVIAAVVLGQFCPVILVGDPHQSIYNFIGSVDTLRMSAEDLGRVVLTHFGVDDADAYTAGSNVPVMVHAGRQITQEWVWRPVLTLRLSRTFRFGWKIANATSVFMHQLLGETKQLVALPPETCVDQYVIAYPQ